ncbi:MAG: biotin--[acetyl-CoA-carboxylase] ligase [Caldisericia bacterium]|nr:biotin--[acetyl-CoA-carboxylase] ligase [Caldisericia bacterium]
MECTGAKRILRFKVLDSTNTYVQKNMDLLLDRTVVIAETQTNGKGRFANTWVSNNSENLYMSFFLKGNQRLSKMAVELTQFMSVVSAITVDSYISDIGLMCQIKWPNDLMVNRRKIAGILAESKWIGSSLTGVALGIGVNLNMNKQELLHIDKPATSLNVCINKQVEKETFIEQFVTNFFHLYEKFCERGMNYFYSEYNKRLIY